MSDFQEKVLSVESEQMEENIVPSDSIQKDVSAQSNVDTSIPAENEKTIGETEMVSGPIETKSTKKSENQVPT